MSCEPITGFEQAARTNARRFYVVASLLLLMCPGFGASVLAAPDEPLPAYEVKSAFLYNFAKFIQWPPKKFIASRGPLIIGVIGRNPFGHYITDLQDKPIGTHRIKVEFYTSVDEARRCHLLFIKDSRARATRIVDELRDADVLTVTDEIDEDSFKSVGAVINLTTTANKTVRFEINVDAARRAELEINSSLLNLAKIVRDGKH